MEKYNSVWSVDLWAVWLLCSWYNVWLQRKSVKHNPAYMESLKVAVEVSCAYSVTWLDVTGVCRMTAWYCTSLYICLVCNAVWDKKSFFSLKFVELSYLWSFCETPLKNVRLCNDQCQADCWLARWASVCSKTLNVAIFSRRYKPIHTTFSDLACISRSKRYSVKQF